VTSASVIPSDDLAWAGVLEAHAELAPTMKLSFVAVKAAIAVRSGSKGCFAARSEVRLVTCDSVIAFTAIVGAVEVPATVIVPLAAVTPVTFAAKSLTRLVTWDSAIVPTATVGTAAVPATVIVELAAVTEVTPVAVDANRHRSVVES